MSIGDTILSWSANVKYLGIIFTSGYKLSFDFKLARSKLFRSYNSIYSKIPRANETVIVSLLKSHCIPVLMYSLEALDLNNTALKSLDHPLVLVFAKIFKTFDKHILNNCMYYFTILPFTIYHFTIYHKTFYHWVMNICTVGPNFFLNWIEVKIVCYQNFLYCLGPRVSSIFTGVYTFTNAMIKTCVQSSMQFGKKLKPVTLYNCISYHCIVWCTYTFKQLL